MSNKTTYYIRILVAGYLLYLSYQIGVGLFTGETNNKWFILAIVFFVACSVFFIVNSVRALSRIAKEEQEAAEAEVVAEEHMEEGFPDTKSLSISERANLAKDLEVPEGIVDEVESEESEEVK